MFDKKYGKYSKMRTIFERHTKCPKNAQNIWKIHKVSEKCTKYLKKCKNVWREKKFGKCLRIGKNFEKEWKWQENFGEDGRYL